MKTWNGQYYLYKKKVYVIIIIPPLTGVYKLDQRKEK